MQTQMRESFVIKPPGRLLYTQGVIAPVAFRDPETGALGNPRYSVQVLIAKTNPIVAAVQAQILDEAKASLPGRDPKTLRLPLKDGDVLNQERVAKGKDAKDFYAGVWVLFAQKPEKSRAGNTLAPPRLLMFQQGKPVDYSEGDRRQLVKGAFYNGVFAAVSVQFKGYSGFGGGITCYLDRLLSLNSGDLIQVGVDDESVFGDADSYQEYIGQVSAESPSAPTNSPW